jgi:hypothetical protein
MRLNRAYAQRDGGLPYFMFGDPVLKNLERDPGMPPSSRKYACPSDFLWRGRPRPRTPCL